MVHRVEENEDSWNVKCKLHCTFYCITSCIHIWVKCYCHEYIFQSELYSSEEPVCVVRHLR